MNTPDTSSTDPELDAVDIATVNAFRAQLDGIHLDRPLASITPTPRRSTRPLRMTAAVAAAAVIAIGGTVVLRSGDDVAYAGWTPTPRAVTDPDRAAMESACEVDYMTLDGNPVDFDGAYIDWRGSIAALSTTHDDQRATCAVQLRDGTWSAFATATGDVAIVDGSTTPSLMKAWNDAASINIIDGTAPAAASVEIDVPDFPTATAPVIDGVFIIWLPDTFDWTDGSFAGLEIRELDANGTVIKTVTL